MDADSKWAFAGYLTEFYPRVSKRSYLQHGDPSVKAQVQFESQKPKADYKTRQWAQAIGMSSRKKGMKEKGAHIQTEQNSKASNGLQG